MFPSQTCYEGCGDFHSFSLRQISAKLALGRLPGQHILHSLQRVYCWSKLVVSITAFTGAKRPLGNKVCYVCLLQIKGWQRWLLWIGDNSFTRAEAFTLPCRSQWAWDSSLINVGSVLRPGVEQAYALAEEGARFDKVHMAQRDSAQLHLMLLLLQCEGQPSRYVIWDSWLQTVRFWASTRDPTNSLHAPSHNLSVTYSHYTSSSQRAERWLGKGQWLKHKNNY